MVTDHELLTDTFEHRIHEHLHAGEVREARDLLVDKSVRVSTLMDHRFIALRVNQSQEDAVQTFRRHARVALPVVNDAGLLLGVVCYDDILDVSARE